MKLQNSGGLVRKRGRESDKTMMNCFPFKMEISVTEKANIINEEYWKMSDF